MKGFSLLLIAAITAIVSGETETKVETPAQNVEEANPLPSLYSLLAQPMFRDGFDLYKSQQNHDGHEEHHGEIMPKPLGALSFFKKELLPPMIIVGLIGAVLYIAGTFIKSFVLAKIGHFLPLPPIARRKREIDSQIDDIATSILEAIRKQQCLEKACCELGYHSRQLQISKGVLPILTKMTSKPMTQAFQTGVIGRKHCEKYSCHIYSS